VVKHLRWEISVIAHKTSHADFDFEELVQVTYTVHAAAEA